MNRNPSPTKENNRLVWIDAARGFAIFGIFIVNVGAFSAPYFIYGGEGETWGSPINQFTQDFIDIFFQASFYTLFSILFGFGFQMMKENILAKDISLYPFLFRRLFILVCFGAIHAFVIWNGDILLSYGLIGFMLLLFLKVKEGTLLIWGVSILGTSVGLLSLSLYQARDYLGWSDDAAISQALENYQSNNLLTIWTQNYHDWINTNGISGSIFLATTLLPLFLFGMFLAKKRWLHEPQKYKLILIKLWIVSFVFFICLKMGPYLFGNPLWFSYIQDNLGGTASALFYITSITLLAQRKIGKRLIQPFIYVGRMALTNYITQSLISFILFYGIGFGLYGSVNPVMGVVIVLIVYTGQVVFSKWWFTKFRFGPLEWVWRSLTYNKRQAFRKTRKVEGQK